MTAVQLENLTFGYKRKVQILKNINLSVPVGSIYGFLGSNGAGKTTTLRLILGLLSPGGGTVQLFEKDIRQTFPKHHNRVGSLIENASLYHHLSASDNLKIWASYFDVAKNRIDEVLHLVDLQEAGSKNTGAFSTGMKQRLGLAISLLHDPDLLILDEPTNGLDPMGIIDLRKTLDTLQAAGKTILLSSHILSEVEKIVTHLGIIHEGSIAFEGTINDLKEIKQQDVAVVIRVDDMSGVLSLLTDKYIAEPRDQTIWLRLTHESEIPKLIKTVVEEGFSMYECTPQRKDLENLFLSITNS